MPRKAKYLRAPSTPDTELGTPELRTRLLRLCRDYLTIHASPRTHDELASYLHTQDTSLDWFIDMLQLTTLNIPDPRD
jgi:hypothetical protein